MSPAELNQFFAEGEPVARLYGVQTPILSLADFEQMLTALSPGFEPHPINTEFLDIMSSGRAAPGVPRGLQRALVNAAVSILPPDVRARLELGAAYDLSPLGRSTVQLMANLADRIPDPNSPAAQASLRLGLPKYFAWKSPAAQARFLDRRSAHHAAALEN